MKIQIEKETFKNGKERFHLMFLNEDESGYGTILNSMKEVEDYINWQKSLTYNNLSKREIIEKRNVNWSAW